MFVKLHWSKARNYCVCSHLRPLGSCIPRLSSPIDLDVRVIEGQTEVKPSRKPARARATTAVAACREWQPLFIYSLHDQYARRCPNTSARPIVSIPRTSNPSGACPKAEDTRQHKFCNRFHHPIPLSLVSERFPCTFVTRLTFDAFDSDRPHPSVTCALRFVNIQNPNFRQIVEVFSIRPCVFPFWWYTSVKIAPASRYDPGRSRLWHRY